MGVLNWSRGKDGAPCMPGTVVIEDQGGAASHVDVAAVGLQYRCAPRRSNRLLVNVALRIVRASRASGSGGRAWIAVKSEHLFAQLLPPSPSDADVGPCGSLLLSVTGTSDHSMLQSIGLTLLVLFATLLCVLLFMLFGWYVVWQLFLSKFKFLRELVGDTSLFQGDSEPSESVSIGDSPSVPPGHRPKSARLRRLPIEDTT